MPSITLTDPVTGTTVASGLIATNNGNLRTLLNSGLDYVNLKGNPQLVANETATWNGTTFVRSSTVGLNLGGTLLFGGDTNLYRQQAGLLKTDSAFMTGGIIYISDNNAGDGIYFRKSSGANMGNIVAFSSSILGDANSYFFIRANGMMQWGTGGTSAVDTNLYRASAGRLQTDGSLFLAGGSSQIFFPGLSAGTNNLIASAVTGDAQSRFVVDGNGKLYWGSGSGAADTNLYRFSGAILKTDNLLAAPSFAGTANYGTSLPTGVDGQEYILVDSLTAPTYQWKFRYNSGSSAAYKWEFVGGAPARAEVDTDETTASTTYVDLTTVGPSFTVPRAGDYQITFGASLYNATTTGHVFISPKKGAAATSDTDSASIQNPTAVNATSVARERTFTGMAASDVIKLQSRVSSGTGHFIARFLYVTPVRVS